MEIMSLPENRDQSLPRIVVYLCEWLLARASKVVEVSPPSMHTLSALVMPRAFTFRAAHIGVTRVCSSCHSMCTTPVTPRHTTTLHPLRMAPVCTHAPCQLRQCRAPSA